MSYPIPGCDPNEAYEVVPLDPIRKPRDLHGWWVCLCNGIPGRFAADRDVLERYASDPDYRASLITKKAWEKNAGIQGLVSPRFISSRLERGWFPAVRSRRFTELVPPDDRMPP